MNMRRNGIRIDSPKTIAAGFPIFIAFFYYLSRQYTEAYYQVYGIPGYLLSFRVEDYLYLGGRVLYGVIIGIAVAFTVLVVGLWQAFIIYRTRKRFYKEGGLSKLSSKKPVNSRSNERRIIRYRNTLDRLRRRSEFFIPIVYLIYTAVALLVALLLIMTLESEPVVKYFGVLLFMATAIASALWVFTEQKIVRFILLKRRLYETIAVLTILVVAIFTQLLPHSIGGIKGIYDQNVNRAPQVFNTVTISTDHPFGGDDLEWQTTERGSYQNAEPLLLLYSSETGLFLISANKTDVTFYVDKQDILLLTFGGGR